MRCVVAVCSDWGIGHEGRLLVRNREDMRRFVALTTGDVVVMGRATYESLPGRRPLKDRRNVVVSRTLATPPEGFELARDLDELDGLLEGVEPGRVWCIGGASLYEQLLDRCDECHVTLNDCVRPADAFFPDLAADPAWELAEDEDRGATPEGVPFRFQVWRRR